MPRRACRQPRRPGHRGRPVGGRREPRSTRERPKPPTEAGGSRPMQPRSEEPAAPPSRRRVAEGTVVEPAGSGIALGAAADAPDAALAKPRGSSPRPRAHRRAGRLVGRARRVLPRARARPGRPGPPSGSSPSSTSTAAGGSLAADKLVLLGRLAELTADDATRDRLCELVAERLPDEPRARRCAPERRDDRAALTVGGPAGPSAMLHSDGRCRSFSSRSSSQVGLTTLLDIGITALLIYWLFSLIRGTRAVSLVIGVSVLFVVYAARPCPRPAPADPDPPDAARSSACSPSSSSSSRSCAARSSGSAGSARSAGSSRRPTRATVDHVADEVAQAAARLSADGHGALIVLERETGLEEVAETGVMIHGDSRADLLRDDLHAADARSTMARSSSAARRSSRPARSCRSPRRRSTPSASGPATGRPSASPSRPTRSSSSCPRRTARSASSSGPGSSATSTSRSWRGDPVAPGAGSGPRPRSGRRSGPTARAGPGAAPQAERPRPARRGGAGRTRRSRPTTTRPPRPPGRRGEAARRAHRPQLAPQARGDRARLAPVRRPGPLPEHADRFTTPVPIEPINQPTDAVLLGNLIPPVTQIRYFAPADVRAGRQRRFIATVDLAGVDPQAGSTFRHGQRDVARPAHHRHRLRAAPDQRPARPVHDADRARSRSTRARRPPGSRSASRELIPADGRRSSGPDSVGRRRSSPPQADVTIDPAGLDVDQDVPLDPGRRPRQGRQPGRGRPARRSA